MRAQVWLFEFIAAIIIVALSAGLFLQYVLREPTDQGYTETAMQAIRASEALMSEGTPSDWDQDTVRRIGITDGGWRINTTKMTTLYNLPPGKVRLGLGISSHYTITLLNQSQPVIIAGKEYIGSKGLSRKSASITRYAIYEGEIMALQVTVWE